MANCIAAQAAHEKAVTGKTHMDQAWLWKQWTTYCSWIGLNDPFLDNFTCHAQIKLLGAFAMAMREACFSRPSHVRLAKGSISGAISHVCQTFCKHGQPNPSLDDNSKTGFLLQQELRAFKKADPAKKHQKAIPMPVISALAKQQLSKLNQAIVQLTGLGMFFAFRSFKYLKVLQAEQHQIEQLHMRNICFFEDREIILYTHPDLEFVDCVSITFEHQKQEDKHDTITYESSGLPLAWSGASGLTKQQTPTPGCLHTSAIK
jgi:hypothetical protein